MILLHCMKISLTTIINYHSKPIHERKHNVAKYILLNRNEKAYFNKYSLKLTMNNDIL